MGRLGHEDARAGGRGDDPRASALAETDVRDFLCPASAEEYWTYATEVLAPVVAGLAAADGMARDRIRATVISQIRTFEHDDQPRLTVHARCTIGTK